MTKPRFLSLCNAPTSADDAAYIASTAGYNEIRNSVFDGNMFRARTNTGTNHLFSDRIWSNLNISIADLSEDIAAFEARNAEHSWDRLRYNFFYFNTFSTGGVSYDWFGTGMSSIVTHLKVAGEYAAKCGFTGIFMDTEPYGPSPWQYSLMPLKSKYTFRQYERQVYDTAKYVVTYWLTVKPNMQIMFSSGYAYYWAYLDQGFPPENNDYGFIRAWLNGIYDGMGEFFNPGYMNIQSTLGRHKTLEFPTARIILSNEGGYGIEDREDETAYLELKESTLGISDPRNKGDSIYFDKLTDFALALRADYNGSGSPNFDNTNPYSNWHTPESFVIPLGYAFTYDDWCWNFADEYFFFQYKPTINSQYSDFIRTKRNEFLMW